MKSGWYPRRRGILEHLENGTISLLDAGIHDFLCLIADYRTGVARASAAKISALCPHHVSLRAVQRSLATLEQIGWIRRFRDPNHHGNYDVVIARFYVHRPDGTCWSVNAEKTIDPRNVRLEPVEDPDFASDSGCQSESGVTQIDTQNPVALSRATVTQAEIASATEPIASNDVEKKPVTRARHPETNGTVTQFAGDVSPLQEARKRIKQQAACGKVLPGNGTNLEVWKAIGTNEPFGPKPFRKAWETVFAARNPGEKTSDTMERAIVRSQDAGEKIPLRFFNLKRKVERLEANQASATTRPSRMPTARDIIPKER